MKVQLLTIFLLVCIWVHHLSAQVSGTGSPTFEELNFIIENIIESEIQGQNELLFVPLKPVLFANTIGDKLSSDALNREIASLNQIFENNQIRFYWLDPQEIVSSQFFDLQSPADGDFAASQFSEEGIINIFFHNSLKGPTGEDWSSYTAAYPSENPRNQIYISNAFVGQGVELARQLGHFFGLLSTSENFTIGELVDGSNCAEAGDLICDTPADGGTRISVNTTTCTHDGSSVVGPGGFYTDVLIENIMSVHPNSCKKSFTPTQLERFRKGLFFRTQSDISASIQETFVSKPTALTAINYGRATVLNWTDLADNETGYLIERATSLAEGFKVIGGVAENVTTFLDTTALVNTSYLYRIIPSNTYSQYSDITSSTLNTICSANYTASCVEGFINKFHFIGTALNKVDMTCLNNEDTTFNFSGVSVTAGNAYNFEVGFGGVSQFLSVWMDLDKNGVFNNEEELLFSSTEKPSGLIQNGEILIPTSAEDGIIAMRVRSNAVGRVTDPCTTYTVGETEDYWVSITGGVANCIASDKQILEQIYLQTNGENWENSTNWLTDAPLDEWAGVATNTQGCISVLNLISNNMQGALPDVFYQLSSLIQVDVSDNQLSGKLSERIGDMRNIASISLNNNKFSDTIPSSIGSLSNLIFLDIGKNNFSGELPTTITQLPLLGISLQDNQIDKISDLTSIETLFQPNSSGVSAQNNRLTFQEIIPNISIPSFRYAPQAAIPLDDSATINHGETYLIDLNIDDMLTTNQYQWFENGALVETSSQNIFQTNLKNEPGEYLYHCFITNPVAPDLILESDTVILNILPTDSTALIALYNATEGSSWSRKWDLSMPISSWSGVRLNEENRVVQLSLNSNNLRGELPQEMQLLTELQELQLSGNNILGTFPEVVFSLKKLEVLWLQDNQLTGQLPLVLGELNNLTFLDLANNQFEGAIPSALANLTQLEALGLEGNQLTTTTDLTGITSWAPSSFAGFQVQNNNFTFSDILPNISISNYRYAPQSKVGEEKQVTINLGQSYKIDLAIDDTISNNVYNWFIDDELFATTDTNSLVANQLGVYRAEVTNPDAPDLTLESFPVTITIPSIDSIHLVQFYQQTNGDNWTNSWDLDGRISDWAGVTLNRFARVIALELPNNNLVGELPSVIDELTALETLDLSDNGLTGTLPNEIYTLSNLKFLNLSNNSFTGEITNNILQLINLELLDISNNDFTVLSDLTSLNNLGVGEGNQVNIKNNQFTFEDLLTNLTLPNFTFNPQQDLEIGNLIILQEGQIYTIDLGIDKVINNNLYTWFRNGIQFEESNQNVLEVSRGGVYSVQVTNPQVANFSLISNELIIQKPSLDSLALVSLYNQTNGDNWTNSWDLSQPMDTWNGVTLDVARNVRRLQLIRNNLQGTLPNELGNLEDLTDLRLADNQLTGNIPNTLGSLPLLRLIWLQENQFTDGIPASFGNLSNLEELDVSDNQLTSIPNAIANLSDLSTLLLDNNQLTIIPQFSPNNPWGGGTFGGLQVQNNRLTFEDLLPNQAISNFRYAPQAEVGQEETLILSFGSTQNLNVGIDQTTDTNLYTWEKDGSFFSETNNPNFTITEIGNFQATITNSVLPLLTLSAKPIEVIGITSPTDLQASSTSFRRVRLTWVDQTDNEIGFVIERALADNQEFEIVDTVVTNITTYEDIEVRDSTQFLYRIQTLTTDGLSPYSNTAQVETPTLLVTASDTIINVGTQVDFRFNASIGVTQIFWEFQGATPETSNERRPTVTYNKGEGVFMIALTITDETGNQTLFEFDGFIEVGCTGEQPTIIPDRFFLNVLASGNPRSFQWFKDGELLEGDTTSTLKVLELGTYTVQVIDEFGCPSVSEPFNPTITGIDNVALEKSISVYPNPTLGLVSILVNKSSPLEDKAIRVFNLLGVQQDVNYSMEQQADSRLYNFDLSTFSKGMYIFQIEIDGSMVYKKLLLE